MTDQSRSKDANAEDAATGRTSVLFLCTGNYFRSRFAEIYFNHCASSNAIPVRAESRGIAIEFGHANLGPISADTLRVLTARGIPLEQPIRYPLPLAEADLARHAHIVAVKETEHRPLLDRKFPGWSDRVEYWQVDDIDCARAEDAIAQLEREVERLLARLGTIRRLARNV